MLLAGCQNVGRRVTIPVAAAFGMHEAGFYVLKMACFEGVLVYQIPVPRAGRGFMVNSHCLTVSITYGRLC